jgi:hypothetical protein
MEGGMPIMMLSPEVFIVEYIDKSYSELISVRDELIVEIRNFEEHKNDIQGGIICPSPKVVYQCNLEYLAKLCELISEKYNKEYVLGDKDKEDGHYLFKILAYLEQKGLRYDSYLASAVKERKAGRQFNIADHVRGLVYSMLTNQTKWYRIEPHLPEIDELFFEYDAEKIKDTSAEYFYNGLFAIKCGNKSTKAQMEALGEDITILKKVADDYGSIDAFVTSEPASEIVQIFSKAGSPYKLKMLGEALVWEYLRNIGIDGAKPDTHLRRFLGSDRMGKGTTSPASVNDVNKQIDSLSEETGLMKMEIDNLIWSFCADGYGKVCTATPNCNICPIRFECKHR